MRFILDFSVFVFIVFQSLPVFSGSGTHPFTVHDMLAMDRISEPQVSQDGKWIVFTLRKTDLDANRGRTDLWLVGDGGTGLRQLTSHPDGDYSPRWLPGGREILFLSTRSGSAQIWKIRMDGGEADQITRLPLDVGNFIISPCGEWLAVTMEVFPNTSPAETAKKLEEIEGRTATGMLYDRIFVRHWDTWKDGRRSHLFVMPVHGGESLDLMPAMDADTPSKPFGGPEEIAFVPGGLVFSARDAGRKEPWSTDFDLYFVPMDGSKPPACFTESNDAWDTQPLLSPDGRTLAYLAMKQPGYEADRFRIVLKSWPEGKDRVLTEEWDRSPDAMLWSPDGKSIIASASNLGQHSIFLVDVKTAKVRTVVQEGTNSVAGFAGQRLVYSMNYLKSPTELYSVRQNGRDMLAITRINGEKTAALRMGDFEQFQFSGWNDETVYGYVVKPVYFDPSVKYPVAFLIHGGPQGSFGNDFHYRWNPQAYTGAGYAVVMVDFHGSVGYGQAFTDAIRGDWGGKPLEDLQKGLAAALARYNWLDGDRVGALGASFGGYMINWIAGRWPGGFRCLVAHDGNFDERMAYFDTEELWFPEWDHMGTPWTNPEGYEKHNPVNLVSHWKTPMLVIHSANDFRVTATHGLAAFNALQRQGIPSKLLYFPDENHWVLKPHNSIQWHETVIGWLDQWLKK